MLGFGYLFIKKKVGVINISNFMHFTLPLLRGGLGWGLMPEIDYFGTFKPSFAMTNFLRGANLALSYKVWNLEVSPKPLCLKVDFDTSCLMVDRDII